ncbi:concanavalin A-like lectin/glucanase domain-containing protein, partial [Glomus cerebriforme]
MIKFAVKEWAELISDPISFGETDQRSFKHTDLPAVNDKLSLTLRLKLRRHSSDWAVIFQKGTEHFIRTPALFLTANKSALHARFTGNWNRNAGINELGDGLLLNKWYHLTYTLSDPEKRLDIYIDGEWTGFYCIQDVKTQKVAFNDGPLYIGRACHNGFNGEISNVRYFNWRLSPEEVKEDFFHKFQKKPIVYGSRIALVHVSTEKYLSTKGIKYYIGPQNQQYMVVTLCQDINHGDDWLIRRYNSTISYDTGHLMNGDIIGLFHINTNKPALYSHPILLGDGTQEVSCYGEGDEKYNKWRIELI